MFQNIVETFRIFKSHSPISISKHISNYFFKANHCFIYSLSIICVRSFDSKFLVSLFYLFFLCFIFFRTLRFYFLSHHFIILSFSKCKFQQIVAFLCCKLNLHQKYECITNFLIMKTEDFSYFA